jgi:hypothetical protein
MGGVHRCDAHARATRLGPSGRRRRIVDDSPTRSVAGGVVRRRAAAVWRVRARRDRLGAGGVARCGRSPNEARPGIGGRAGDRRGGRQRFVVGGRGSSARSEGGE